MKKIISVMFIVILTIYTANMSFANGVYKAKDYSYLKGQLQSLSDEQIDAHLKLYKGYVKKINKLNAKLKKTDTKNANPIYSDYRSVNSARSFAHNGVVLHELYFSNLTNEENEVSEELKEQIIKDFGSYKDFLADLKSTAKSARSGWTITAYNCKDNMLHNYIIDEHDLHLPILIEPILILDVWEHAFMIDYGIDKNSYLDAIIKELNWSIISKRYNEIMN